MVERMNQMIYDTIPIAGQAMRIVCLSIDPTQATFLLPAAPNRNDKGTLFAGSIASSLSLCGWALAMAQAYQAGFANPWAAIVDSQIHYGKALTQDAIVTARLIEPATLDPHGKNWLHIHASIDLPNHPQAVTLTARYAVGQHSA